MKSRVALAVAVLLVLALLVGGGWLVRSGTDRDPTSTRAAGASGSSAQPALNGGARPDEGLLTVVVLSAETGEPAGAIVRVRKDPGAGGARTLASASEGGREGWEESRGRFLFPLPAGVDHVLSLARGSSPRREVGERTKVSALHPGEEREVVLELPTAPDLVQFVRVVRDTDGAPVVGAEVRPCAESVTWNRDLIRSTSIRYGERATTDAAGLASITVRSWEDWSSEVNADGFGTLLFQVVRGHASVSTALDLRLRRAGELRGELLDEDGRPGTGWRIELRTDSRNLQPDHELWGWPLQAGGPGGERRWYTRPGPDGRFVLADLPSHVPLAVSLVQATRIVRPEAEPLRLAAGETREVQWRIGAACTLRGMVLDGEDAPVAYEELWLAPENGLPHFRFHDEKHAVARTDEQGEFVFPDVPPGSWSIGPAPTKDPPEEPRPDALAPRRTSVEIPPGSPEEYVVVRVHRGLYIRGRVLDVDGEPLSRAAWVCAWDEEGGQVAVPADENGSFALGPLAPGEHNLEALPGDGPRNAAPSEPVTAQAGDEGIVLRLCPGAALICRVVDDATDEPVTAWIRRHRTDSPDSPSASTAGFAREGRGRFDALPPGTYDVVATTEDGRIGVRQAVEVKLGEDPAEVEVRVRPAAWVRVSYAGSTPVEGFLLHWEGTYVGYGQVAPDGRSWKSPVPPGRVTIRLTPPPREGPHEKTVEAQAGETVTVAF